MQQAGETIRNITYDSFIDFLELIFMTQDGK